MIIASDNMVSRLETTMLVWYLWVFQKTSVQLVYCYTYYYRPGYLVHSVTIKKFRIQACMHGGPGDTAVHGRILWYKLELISKIHLANWI